MGLGFVAIILGWYGAAHSSYQFQEIPYLISGGLFGVALVAGGGFLFFAAFLVRMIEENRKFNARVVQTMARLDQVLNTDGIGMRSQKSNGVDADPQPTPPSGSGRV